ncbi:MAG TPA: hypothetical protein VMW65_03940 [Chloroflexota bacterium]|nr:hypothetical protein [Chloroflexota bacterium]
MATLEASLDRPRARSYSNEATGRIGWRAIDPDVESRTDVDYARPQRLRDRLMAWLIEYNKY